MNSTSLFLFSLLLLLVTGAIGKKTKEKFLQSEETVRESFSTGSRGHMSRSSEPEVFVRPQDSIGDEASEEMSSSSSSRRRSKIISSSSDGSNMEGESSYSKRKKSRFSQDALE
nr:Seminal vesicle secretory protein 4 [Mus musculus]AAI15606.1 Seminal vesicle secretory protein 4 [Mus musculus]